VIRQLRVVYRALQNHSRSIEKTCGVSAAQLWALWELHRAPGLRVGDLSQRLLIHPSTASNMLDKLEGKHLVERRRTGMDQRVVSLFLTDRGETLLQAAPAPAQGDLNRALQALPAHQLSALESGLAACWSACRRVTSAQRFAPSQGTSNRHVRRSGPVDMGSPRRESVRHVREEHKDT
jgi:MarR family transcriptional regulator, organic hydroperoxide resistance regulator